ncbi:MAG: AzlD domain-containing protein [Spirochaeta sp.]|nr:AzlD domain-containing protein [Spirochaeta sp.]
MSNSIWPAILGMAAITYGTRVIAPLLMRSVRIPAWFEQWLRFVPGAVLAALVLPAVFVHDGSLVLSPLNPYLVGATVAAVLAVRTRNLPLTVLFGLSVVILLERFM